MRKDRLLIFDKDEDYICHLAEWINRQESLPLRAEPFTEKKALEEAVKEEKEGILLTGPDLVPEEELKGWSEKMTVILLDEEGQGRFPEEASLPHGPFPVIGRYQSAEKIVRQLLEASAGLQAHARDLGSSVMKEAGWRGTWQAASAAAVPFPAVSVMPGISILGVYSPVGRCGKSAFALCLGEELARKGKTLYLNLECYSGFREMLPGDGTADLADLFYFARRQEGNLLYKLNAAVRSFQRLDYILPPVSFYDLAEIEAEEWKRFFALLAVNGEYETLVLDIGTGLWEVFSLLAFCRLVFVPVLEDALSKAKISQFSRNFLEIGGGGAQEKIRSLSLPYIKTWRPDEEGIQALLAGPMGEYVRHLVRAEGNRL